jgi:hypothetical protein
MLIQLTLNAFNRYNIREFTFIYIYSASTIVDKLGWEHMAHTYNPSYSGGRVREDHGLTSSWENS